MKRLINLFFLQSILNPRLIGGLFLSSKFAKEIAVKEFERVNDG